MKLYTTLTLAGLGLGTAILSVQGCSSSSGTTTDGGTEGGASAESERPPAKEGPATSSTTVKHYGLYTLSLGGADRSGAPSQTAWKKYGYDLDGKASTDKSTDHCKLKAGAAAKIKQDGDKGIDNSFGANILPIIDTAAPDSTKSINDSIRTGAFTVIIETTGFDDSAAQTNTGLKGQLFAGAKLTNPPKWDGTDEWPVLSELLADGNSIAGGSKVKFADAYVNKGLFVSGTDATVSLSLSVSGAALTLSINKATISFQKPAAAGGLDVANGTIAGVLNTAELISELKKVAGRISDTLCQGSTFDQIAAQIAQASDIMSDGTNGDSSKECNGISIGVGFTAKALKAPTKVEPRGAPTPDPCAAPPPGDAGGGG